MSTKREPVMMQAEHDTDLEADLRQARARSAFTAEQGKIWVARKQALFDALPKGTVVIIDIATGGYVTGATYLDATPLFNQRFGSSALGFVHRIGERTFIGGGIG
jgi:hypothetical protein